MGNCSSVPCTTLFNSFTQKNVFCHLLESTKHSEMITSPRQTRRTVFVVGDNPAIGEELAE
jgi:hypothetical protein